MPDPYDGFDAFRIDRPGPGLVRITLDGPDLNAIGPEAHRQLADIWTVVDRDAGSRVAVLAGAGRAFSAGGSFGMLEAMTNDGATRLRVLREARDLVTNILNCSKPIISAIRGPAVGAGWWPPCWPTSRWPAARPGSSTVTPASASPPATTRPSAGR